MYYANILTGGIGCGKSTTARLLALHGLRIIDADIIAHEALESVAAEVIEAFGVSILVDSQIHDDFYCDSSNSANLATPQPTFLGGRHDLERNNYESTSTFGGLRSAGRNNHKTTSHLDELQSFERKDYKSNSSNNTTSSYRVEPCSASCHVEHSETSPNSALLKQSQTLLNPYHAQSSTKQPKPTIDRKKLGALIFQDSEKKAQLEQILHPIIHQNIMQECERLEQRKTPFFIDLPLYFESKHSYPARFVVCVYAPKHIQIERIQKRNNYTFEEAQSRVDSQLDIETKRAQSHFVIENTKDLKTLQHNVETFLQTFLAHY